MSAKTIRDKAFRARTEHMMEVCNSNLPVVKGIKCQFTLKPEILPKYCIFVLVSVYSYNTCQWSLIGIFVEPYIILSCFS